MFLVIGLVVTIAVDCAILFAIVYLGLILKSLVDARGLLNLVVGSPRRRLWWPLSTALTLDQRNSARASRFSERHVQNPPHPFAKRERRILRVLVAEDLPANRELLRNILRKQGYVVAVARDGKEAVELARKGHFDLILMDIQMPEMNGLEAARAIRKGTVDSDIPIVAVSALTTAADRNRCVAAGMDGYVAKPVEQKRLLDLIDSVTTLPGTAIMSESKGEKTMPPIAQSPTANPSGAPAVVYDPEGTLRRLGGDKNLLGDLVALYDEDSPGLIQRLADAIQAGQGNLVRHAAHSLRGLAANFGAAALSRPLLELEEAGNRGQLEEAPNLLEAVRLESAKLQDTLSPYRR